jgi:hypothetical protein
MNGVFNIANDLPLIKYINQVVVESSWAQLVTVSYAVNTIPVDEKWLLTNQEFNFKKDGKYLTSKTTLQMLL